MESGERCRRERNRGFMYKIRIEESFDSAHFLAGYEGKCSNLHGHRWRIVMEAKAETLHEDGQLRGMVMDFGDIRRDLKELADANLHAAQTKLMDILSNYQGFKKCTLILVFDAYKIEGHAEEVITYHNIHVVYTKEAETADQYIEKTVHKIGRENQVTVATSDGLEQIIIMGQGAHRMSARGLRDEIKATENQIRQQWHEKRQSSKNYLIDNISDEMAQYMKEKRLEKQ